MSDDRQEEGDSAAAGTEGNQRFSVLILAFYRGVFQVTQTAIAKKFGCNQSTISDIFKKKNAIQSRKSDNGEKVLVSPKFPEIERVLAEWCTSCLSKGAVIRKK